MDTAVIKNLVEVVVTWSCMVVHYRNSSKFPQTKLILQAQLCLRQVNRSHSSAWVPLKISIIIIFNRSTVTP